MYVCMYVETGHDTDIRIQMNTKVASEFGGIKSSFVISRVLSECAVLCVALFCITFNNWFVCIFSRGRAE